MLKLKMHFTSASILLGIIFLQGLMAQTPCEIYTENFKCEGETMARVKEAFDCSTDLVGTTLDLMERGDEEIEYSDGEEAVMLIGTTGTGKSTLTYFIAGNNSQMISYKKSTGTYLIKDCHGKISGNSTIVSATIFPDLVVHEETQTAFYDNPGFQDTRTACIEIANAYFMKKIANHVRKLKFIIVINQNSVIPGADRVAFIGMIRSVINFLPNIEKYGDGLALVGTKLKFDAGENTENPYIEDAKAFLRDNRGSLTEVFKDPEDLRKAEFIVDTLVNNNSPNKVGMFRAPTDCGLLSQLQNMQDNKLNMSNMITNNLNYIESAPTDFGFSLSADARIAITEIGRKLSEDVVLALGQFSRELYNYMLFQFSCLATSTCDSLITDLEVMFSNPDFAAEYKDEDIWKTLNFTQIVSRIVNNAYIPSKLVITPGVLETLEKSAIYLEFLESFEELHIDVITWLGPMKVINNDLKSHIVSLISSIDQTIPNVTKYLTVEFFADWTHRLDYIATAADTSVIPELQTSFNNFYSALYPSLDDMILLPSQQIAEIVFNIRTFNEGKGEDKFGTLVTYSKWLDSLEVIKFVELHPKQWISPLEVLKTDLSNYVVEEFVPTIEQMVNDSLKNLSSNLAQHRITRIDIIPDIFEKQLQYLEYLTEIETLKFHLRLELPDMDIEWFIMHAVQGIIELGLPSSFETIEVVIQKIPYLHLIESADVSTIIPEKKRETWLNTLLYGNSIIHDQQYWNDFLIHLFEDLSTMNVQVDDEFGYKVWWATFGQVSNQTFSSVWTVFGETSAVQETDYNKIVQIVQDHNFVTLNSLLNITLTSDFKCEQDGPISIGRGRYISLKDILTKCATRGTTKTIIMLGTHTTFLDSDAKTSEIDSADNVDIFIMSPKWWIRNDRIINLNGINANEPPQESSTPGLSGGKSGNLFGIGQFFEHGTLLVTANGGHGSNGRDGVDGIIGTDGGPNEIDVNECKQENWFSPYIQLKTKYYYTCTYRKEDIPPSDARGGWCDAQYGNSDGIWFHVPGHPGGPPTPGKPGGKRGYGGLAGNVVIAQVGDSDSSNVKPPERNGGLPGKDGRGGRGALGGNRGPVSYARGDDQFMRNKCKISDKGMISVSDRGPSSEHGVDGGNDNGWTPPKKQEFDPASFALFVNEFKMEASRSDHELFKSILTDFLTRVDKDEIFPAAEKI